MLSHFLDPPGNHPRGAIFPTMGWINQSSVDSHCKPLGWLIGWRQVNFDLTGLLDSYRMICFYGAGLKGLNSTGEYNSRNLFWLRPGGMRMWCKNSALSRTICGPEIRKSENFFIDLSFYRYLSLHDGRKCSLALPTEAHFRLTVMGKRPL